MGGWSHRKWRSVFFFFWGGMEILIDRVRPKNGGRQHFEGLKIGKSWRLLDNFLALGQANGRARSWSTHIVRCQFGALKHESLLTAE